MVIYGIPIGFISESRLVVSSSLRPHGLYSPWNSPGQNTGVGRLPLLQGIFPTQGLNPGLQDCRRILYQLIHKGSPRTLERVVNPFSSGSSWPSNQTRLSCTAGRFFTNWALREAIAWEMSAIVQWFEHSLVLSFLGIRLEIDFFSVLWPLLSFPNVLTYWV